MLQSSHTKQEITLQNVRNKDMSLVLSSDAKPRLKWTQELHKIFVDAVNQLGGANKATPKSLMRVMGVNGLTLYHLKSHLQKYRIGKNKPSQSYYEDYKDNQSPFTSKNCDGEHNQINESLQIAQALQVQMEVQRKIHEQIEVQRHLQLRIKAQGKYLQNVLKKAQETLAEYSATSTEVEQAKAELSQLVAMVDIGCPSPSVSILTESEGLLLKDANHLPRHTRCSLESSLTSSESSGREEETRPMLDFDDNEKNKVSETCNRKRNYVVLPLMEMHPAEKSGLESPVSDMKRNRSNIYDGHSIVQPSGKRSEGDRSHEQLIKFGSLETFDLNSRGLTEFNSGPKEIDLNCNAVEQFTENL
ncbi:myb family transcription factor PHL8-like isoform X2 [Olea europaea var. sylvestris]|uniref:myb family transcription factor PHL8-like isoform X2 n=1 Tax=Olea europaea var. sylvestris TaxID=158386 RepID=UPI000C1D7FB3|nr:myb family transcription factor PHL8-like isoform X2 [Olea europaea var. sylvestris]